MENFRVSSYVLTPVNNWKQACKEKGRVTLSISKAAGATWKLQAPATSEAH